MTPSAPGRFSITTGCAHRTDRRSAKSLAVKSEALPAGTGRIKCTARSGQALAESPREQHRAAAKRKHEIILHIDFNSAVSFRGFPFTSARSRANIFLVRRHDLEHK